MSKAILAGQMCKCNECKLRRQEEEEEYDDDLEGEGSNSEGEDGDPFDFILHGG